jgi:O-antigen/teichoic acid export membrane protein
MKNKNAEFDKSLKLLAKSSVIVFIGVVLSKILTYVYRIVIARQFGPEVYGLFSLAIMITGWFILLSTLGLGEGVLRFISRYRGKGDKDKIGFVFKSSIKILFLTGTLAAIILFSLSSYISNKIFNEPELAIFIKFFSLSIPFSIILTIFLATLRSHERIGHQSFIANILSPALKVIFLISFIALGYSVRAVILSHVFEVIAVFIIAFFICKHCVKTAFKKYNLDKKTKSKVLKSLLNYSLPLFFAGFFWKVFHWADSFLIGYFQSATEVGIYNAAIPIALLMTMSIQLFMQLFFPMVNREYAKGQKETVKELSKQVGKWVFLINLPIIVLIILFPRAFLNILFGSEFIGGANALRFLSIGALFLSFFEISNRLIGMSGRSKVIFVDFLVASIINIILNIILIPRYGITGAAFATMTSSIILSAVFAFQAKHYLSIVPMRKKMYRAVIAVAISATLLIFFRNLAGTSTIALVILTIFFFALYILLVFIFKGFDKNDIMIINTFKRKFTLNASGLNKHI